MSCVLVIGTPKSGTHAAAAYLRTQGIRALHEVRGRDGCVSAWLSVPDWWNPAASRCGVRSDYEPDTVIHLVRYPLDAIASLAAFEHPAFWQWQERHTGLGYEPGNLEFFAHFWVRWNHLCSAQTEKRLRCEDLTGVPFNANWATPNKKPVAWSDLGPFVSEVRRMAERFGYN